MTNGDYTKDYSRKRKSIDDKPVLNPQGSLSKIINLVKEAKMVLDIGCADGSLAQYLKDFGCHVTGIDVSAEMTQVAKQYCDEVYTIDLDTSDIGDVLGSDSFDVVVCADVLEHLKDPAKTLREIKGLLKKQGFIIASIPNVAHGAVRLALLKGNFDYQKFGILDNTHLRFFTRASVIKLFEEAGYFPQIVDITKCSIFGGNLVPKINREDFEQNLLELIEQSSDSEVLQFIVKAFPESLELTNNRLKEENSCLKKENKIVRSDLKDTEKQLQDTEKQLQDTEKQLQDTEKQLQDTEKQLQDTEKQLQDTEKQLQDTEKQLQDTEKQLQDTEKQLQDTEKQLQDTEKQLQDTKKQLQLYRYPLNSMKSSKNRDLWEVKSHIKGFKKIVLMQKKELFSYVKHPLKIKKIFFIARCGLFSSEYYLNTYLDVAQAEENPIIHYLQHGYLEGRKPNFLFDSEYYLKNNPDVFLAQINPLIHYEKYGFKEGRNPCAEFDTKYYLNSNPDVLYSGLNPLYHYLNYGIHEGRRINSGSNEISPSTKSNNIKRFYCKQHRLKESQEASILTDIDMSKARSLVKNEKRCFSVIIPTWNRCKTIRKSIDSVLNQSFKSFKIIIIDDGSEDGTEEYLKNIYSENFKINQIIYFWQEHKGVSEARNYGLSVASGDWIAYLDSDNIWHQDYLLATAAAFIENPEKYTHYASLKVEDNINKCTFIRNQTFDWGNLVKSNFIDLNVFSHHRRLYNELGGFDNKLTRLVDWDLILRYTWLYPPIFTNAVLADYQISKDLNNITLTENLEANRDRIWTKNQWNIIRASENELKLAYILNDFPALTQTFVNDEIGYLVQEGYDVKVYYTIQPDKKADIKFEVDTYFVHNQEDLEILLVKHGRNWCHSHFVYPVVTNLVYLVAEKLQIPFSFMPHAVDIFHKLNCQRNKITEVSRSKFCKKIFVYGNYHRDFLIDRDVPASKILMMPQAVDCNLVDISDENKLLSQKNKRSSVCYRSVTIARFIEKKGIKYLLEAAAQFAPDQVEFHIYGFGPLENEFRDFVRDNHLNQVFIHGAIEGKDVIASILSEADIFILPCIEAEDGNVDGMPTVFFQAMSMGVPVLGTKVSAIPDFIDHRISGFLVPQKDSLALAQELKRVMGMSRGQINRVIENAKQVVDSRVGLSKTVNTLLDVIARPPIDIFMVTYCRDGIGSFETTKQVIQSIVDNTTTPFILTIIDNASEAYFVDNLRSLTQSQDCIRLIELDRNIYCGPASNIALDMAEGEYSFYVCSNEGLIVKPGWERICIDYMRNHKNVALAGNLVSSPKWPTALQYMQQSWFVHFRNQDFARQNPDKLFRHVQGGLWVLRSSIFKEVGGFNPALPQGHMDVEYSYFLESKGWELGDIPEIISVSNKTRPGIEAFVNESTVAIHPVYEKDLPLVKWCAEEKGYRCNISGWTGDFNQVSSRESFTCPLSGSTGFSRSVYRYLAESPYIYIHLKLVAWVKERSLETPCRSMFAVEQYLLQVDTSIDELFQSLKEPVDILIMSDVPQTIVSASHVDKRIRNSIKPGGCFIFSLEEKLENELLPQQLGTLCQSVGFEQTHLNYNSNVLGYGLLSVYVWKYNPQFRQNQNYLRHSACNICGSQKFGYGPGGRTSRTGLLPRCEICQSLERHRAFRNIFEQLHRADVLKDLKTLQFSRDSAARPEWFASHEVSVYGEENSLDLANVNRSDKRYDLVICNHVLEHVEDDCAALKELARIINDDGFIFLTFPDPMNQEITKDWGYPDHSQHGHYRIYGKDVIKKFQVAISSLSVLTYFATDPATKEQDMVFLICKASWRLKQLSQALPSCQKLI